MADASVATSQIRLIDRWPGPVEYPTSPPDGDIISANVHNTSAQLYDLGTKIGLFNQSILSVDGSGVDGFSTFIYLKGLTVGTVANPTLAAKQLVVPGFTGDMYQVTNDPDQCLVATGSLYAAVVLTVMTFTHETAKFGWFWCGGPCPIGLVEVAGTEQLDGTILTEGNLAAAQPFVAHDLVADSIGLGPCGADTEAIIGWSDTIDS